MSFISRLAGAAEEPVLDAIARNLEAVLNAKRGYAGEVEVLGLGRYDVHLGTKELVDALSAEMLEQVRRHEPRLREPKLTLLGKDRALWVRFSLSARLDGQTQRFVVLFHSALRNVRVLHER